MLRLATKTKGIFRVSGSAKRVSELQLIFDTPPNYGSQLDWTGFTIHDASNVLRRYLNHLPDPVITLEFYEKFRDVHRKFLYCCSSGDLDGGSEADHVILRAL